MTSHLTSTLFRRTSSFRHSNLGGLTDTIRSIGNNNSYSSNEYIHKNFFEGDNYSSIIKCLDGGYDIANDLLEYMQDRLDILKDLVDRLTSHSTKWKSKIKNQSSYSSYNTTKRAQLQVIDSSTKHAQIIQIRCNEIQQVINSFKKQIDRMYPNERFSTTRKHYQSDSMKTLFKNARAPIIKLNEKLERLHDKEKSAQNNLRDAMIQLQNLELDVSSSKSKLSKARDNQETKQRDLKDIKDKILRIEQEYQQEQNNYYQKAMEIYQQCRILEQERLEQIRDVLIKFTQVIHSGEYSTEQDKIYNDLLVHIKSEQDTTADLDFWANTYHVNILTKSVSIENDQNDENTESQTTTTTTQSNTSNLTTIDENSDQIVNEIEEKSTTSTKSKTRKKKNNTTEPTTPETTA